MGCWVLLTSPSVFLALTLSEHKQSTSGFVAHSQPVVFWSIGEDFENHMKYAFVEIGTSDFDTEIQACEESATGLSIEPVKRYLDNLPDKKNVKKINCAVSDYDGTIKIYYVTDENIKKHSLPEFVRGCNSVNKPHPILTQVGFGANIPSDLINVDEVPVKTFQSLAAEYEIESIDFLKIDTEGHDCVILRNYLAFCASNPGVLAKRVLFESNQLSTANDVWQIINRFMSLGYTLISTSRGENTIVEKR